MDIAIGLFYESGGAANANNTSSATSNTNRNIHEISAELSSDRNRQPSSRSQVVLLSDSEDDGGAVIINRGRGGGEEFESQEEEGEGAEDVIFNSKI